MSSIQGCIQINMSSLKIQWNQTYTTATISYTHKQWNDKMKTKEILIPNK